MERAVFDRMAEHDEQHWWYVARRRILADLIARKVKLPENARILEIGAGTGHNFGMLRRFGRIDAIEIDEEARTLASKRLGAEVGASPLPDLPGIEDGAYHLIALLDVLEHVDEDQASLRSIARKLAPGGSIIVTVPSYQWMWSAHDEVHHHKRRYSKRGLRNVIEEAGLKADLLTHFNSLLFPAAAGARIVGKAMGKTSSDDNMPSRPVNGVLRSIFGLERHLVGRVPLPFGVSLVAILSQRTTR
jgi:SAM-dependent methyltransferase